MILRNSNSSNRVRISFMGFDCDFFAMAHTPTTTCLPSAMEPSASESEHKSDSVA